MAKYIIEVPDEVPVSDGLVPFDMCRPSWYWEAYEKGKAEKEDEVRELVRIICDMTQDERKERFGGSTCDLDRFMTYQSTKAEYESWLSQKDLRIGDEVILPDETRGIVMDRDDDDCVVINKDSYTIVYHVSELRNTGRHHDCIINLAEVLKRYRDAV